MNYQLFIYTFLLFSTIYGLERVTLTRKPVPKNQEIMKSLIKFARKNSTNESYKAKIDLFDFQDVQYFGMVYVGSQKAPFQVLFDTGSDIFWIPGIDIYSSGSCAVNHRKYDCSASWTCVNLNVDDEIDYLKGSTKFHLVSDTLTIGDVSVKSVQTGLVYEGDCEGSQFDGIIGMSLQMRAKYPPLFQTMIAQHVVSYPVFSFFLNKAGNSGPGGELSLGGWDSKYNEQDFNYIPVVPGGFWRVRVDSVRFGDIRLTGLGSAVLDTGTSLIICNPATASAFALKIGGSILSDIIMVECTRMNLIPPLVFTINGEDYYLTAEDLLYTKEDGLCVLGIGGNGQINDNEWLLGDTFLSRFYSIHDYQNRRVALIPLNSSSSSPTTITTTKKPNRGDGDFNATTQGPIFPIRPNIGSTITYSISTIFTLIFLVVNFYKRNN